MDVTRTLLRLSLPRAFVVVVPGNTDVRLSVEREIRTRGWSQVLTPADANMLVICGDGGAAHAESVDRVWGQMPTPRTFVKILTFDTVAQLFDEARAALCDLSAVRRDAKERNRASRRSTQPSGTGESMQVDAQTHADSGDMDMGMDLPGGVAMADRGPDRDGLKLDQLHVVLGPMLSDWPTGLVAHLVLQGDIVQSAEVEVIVACRDSAFWLDAEAHAEVASHIQAAAAADSMQRFLGVAGWESAAATGRWLRDVLLESDSNAVLDPRFVRWIRRVRRSRMLRWSMNGLGVVASDAPDQLRGDVSARYERWADEIASALGNPVVGARPVTAHWGPKRAERARTALSFLPALLVGQEFTAARLIVASLDPDLDALRAHTLPDSHD